MRYETMTSVVVGLVMVVAWPRPGQAQTVSQQIRLSVGESTLIQVQKNINRVVVGNPRVADVQATGPREVLVVGRGRGTTNITATTSGRERYTYSVQVTDLETGSLVELVRGFLGPMEGIFPRIYGDTVIIEGEAASPGMYERAQKATDLFGSKVKNFVRFRPSAVEQLNRSLRKGGLGDVQASLVGGKVFLEGSVGSPEDQVKAQAVAKAFGLDAENMISVGRSTLVEVDVEFVEIRRLDADKVGIQWPTFLGGTGSVTAQQTVSYRGGGVPPPSMITMNVESEITAGLNLLITDNRARLLSHPRLVCASGAKAEFFVGGEVPFPLKTEEAFRVEFKEFGVKLEVEPTADARGNIRMDLLTAVSAIDNGIMINGNPGFRTRRVNTSVTVQEGQSIVLSGLYSNDESQAIQRFPLLGHIPLLGELFKSRDFREERSNLVIFVTPRVVTPQAPRVRRAIDNIQRMYREAERHVRWGIFD